MVRRSSSRWLFVWMVVGRGSERRCAVDVVYAIAACVPRRKDIRKASQHYCNLKPIKANQTKSRNPRSLSNQPKYIPNSPT